jgi:prevent-host-death family protein
MVDIVNIHHAKSTLSSLVARVEAGEEIVIARAGKPIARLVPYRPPVPVRQPGSLRGSIVVHGRLDDPDLDAEIARSFEAPLEVPSDR